MRTRSVSFENLDLIYENRISGFVFEFELDALDQEQLQNGELVTLTGLGTVNGQSFSIDGKHPRGSPVKITAGLGDASLELTGEPLPDIHRNAFRTELALETGEIGDFLEMLKLKRSLEGSGRMVATLIRQPGRLGMENIDIKVNLADGQSAVVIGSIGNVYRGEEADVSVDLNFYPEGKVPAPARKVKDLKLTRIEAHITSDEGGLELERAIISTNAYGREFEQIGPIQIGRVYRTEDETLRLEDIDVQAGPSDAPILQAHGDVNDILAFTGITFGGTLVASPESLAVLPLHNIDSLALGRIRSEFEVSDSAGHLSLNSLTAKVEETELWGLDVSMTVKNLGDQVQSDLHVKADILDSAGFMSALGLKPVETGRVDLSLRATIHGLEFDSSASFGVAGTQIDTVLNSKLVDGVPIIRGGLTSDRISVPDLRNIAAAGVQLASLNTGGNNQDETAEEAEQKPAEQPFVLPKEAKQAQSARELVNTDKMLRKLDLEFSIDIGELYGPKGATPIKSNVDIKEGRARAGPIRVKYGGGYFNVSAAMDLIDNPERVQITGGTGGWDFGKILREIDVGIGASGTVRGKFNLTGNRSSVKSFINSMYGSVIVAISSGTVETTLLELAGLGVFPWLFSEERKQGYSTLVCVVAPLKIAGGKVTSNRIVAETRSVQLVASGEVNWRRDTIDLRAEPRPVGKPLHRSAWPFDVTGRLSDPQFKLQVGGEKAKRGRKKVRVKADRKPCVPDALQVEPRSRMTGNQP